MIGDCMEADVQGALDAGLDAIFFNGNNKVVADNIKQVNHYVYYYKQYKYTPHDNFNNQERTL